jgi:putative ABC transport system permease protein
MKYIDTFKIAIRALKKSKLRTFLTVLGVVIGITSVSVIISAGDSMEELITGQVSSFGSDLIQTEVRVPSTGGGMASQAQGVEITTLTLNDKEAIEDLPYIKQSYAVLTGQELLSWQGNISKALIYAVSSEFIDIDSSEIDQGRFYTQEEDESLAKVIVLGSGIKEDIFGASDAVGQNVKINKTSYKVIGTMQPRGAVFFFDMDDMVYIPIQTTQKLLLGVNYVAAITSQMADVSQEDEAVDAMVALLRERHDISNPDRDDFEVMSMADAQELMSSILGGVTLLLIALAGVSLVVGGVGIMNIMYATVAERTFEIGLRKAVGSTKADIMKQFLIESLVVTFLGGAGGVLLGLLITYLVSLAANLTGFEWAFTWSIGGVLLSLGFSMAIGLIFGLYPAKKAANLNPITALRKD